MTARAKRIVADALSLDRTTRSELMQKLLLSLDDGPRDKGTRAAWLKEIARRREEIAAGDEVLISHEDMMREAWAQLNASRRNAS